MGVYDELQTAVLALSGGRNECILIDDAMGIQYPSIFVRYDKGTIGNAIGSSDTATHPAFKIGTAEKDAFYMGKYKGRVVNGHMLSLPLQDPSTGQNTAAWTNPITGTSYGGGLNFDQALTYCRNNGDGHHLATQAEYAWIALRCLMNGFMPDGNNYYGKDYAKQYEKGVVSYQYTSGGTVYDGRTATGTGTVSWNDDNTEAGTCDLNGGTYEWQAGMRYNNGEINVIANNDAAINADGILTDLSAASGDWKGIMPDGSLVTAGTAGTLKFDYIDDPGTVSAEKAFQLVTTLAHQQTGDAPYGAMAFKSIAAASGVTVPDILKYLAIMPFGSYSFGDDNAYMRNNGERLPFRGGYWGYTSNAGVFCSYGIIPRSNSGHGVGARPAFYKQA